MSLTAQYIIVFLLIVIAVTAGIILIVKSRRQGVNPGGAGCALSDTCAKKVVNESNNNCHEDYKVLGKHHLRETNERDMQRP